MFGGIALAWSALPLELIRQHRLDRHAYERGGEREVQFLYRHRPRWLPVWHEGQLRLVLWGNRRGESRRLPCTGWTWQATVEAGTWADWGAVPVDVPATMGLENGVWYRITQARESAEASRACLRHAASTTRGIATASAALTSAKPRPK